MFSVLLSSSIENYNNITDAEYQVQRHMAMSATQKDITFATMGDSVTGISNVIGNDAYEYDYSYTNGNNYLNDYQRTVAKDTTTRDGWKNNSVTNYGNSNYYRFSNQLYGNIVNVYPDELDRGSGDFYSEEMWDSYPANRNKNSILKKTKDLFKCRKINTIISSFHTNGNNKDLYDYTESGTSDYGLSHGRNLLSYNAEKHKNNYSVNGYDNPFCRVWTHHYQYTSQRDRLIRPFYSEDKNGENTSKNEKLHNWGDSFKDMTYESYKDVNGDSKKETWGWKDKGSEGWAYSVLDKKTGFVNITPKYLGGRDKNVHTKDCMFSIENLAWQGYDPYSFERALSWEQRGPFGGRIMWFPPYGLDIHEDTSVNWGEESFIGRGENVYTYTNTIRTGTLSFKMVVDHPSILDYATWHDSRPDDTTVLRFLAGCDSVNDEESSLLHYVKPTPLTDEYIKKDTDKKEVKEEKKEQPTNAEDIKLVFFVFYPNNYSGFYDNKEGIVNPIAYLLFGKWAQWECNDEDVMKSKSLPLTFVYNKENDKNKGNGYEMNLCPLNIGEADLEHNYIIGTGNPKGFSSDTYLTTDKKWYYRIDGEYVKGITDSDTQNCFGQNLVNSNYRNLNTFGLNFDIKRVNRCFTPTENEQRFSLAEVAYAMADEQTKSIIAQNANINEENNDRIQKLFEYIGNSSQYEISEIKAIGYATTQGNNKSESVNEKRNIHLAKQRAETAKRWLTECLKRKGINIENTKLNSTFQSVKPKTQEESVNTIDAKKCRSAKVIIKLKKIVLIKNMDLNVTANDIAASKNDATKAEEKNGIQLYVFPYSVNPQQRWFYNENTGEYQKYYSNVTLGAKERFDTDTNEGDKNTLRYDQEYYFFKKLKQTHPAVFSSLVEKLQYFDPAFHSMTPEGFMGRLNFLHQCTRQGGTIGASDYSKSEDAKLKGYTAKNLAFGRPPFCILRLGDFYYQKIVIRALNISYDPLVLDLNNEGVGVVPLIANVSINFNFIGGGDLTGPVRRLQNAVTANYYANGRLYDNRSDRVEYQDTMYDTMQNDGINFDNSYFHHVKMKGN